MIKLKTKSYELLIKCLEIHRPDLIQKVEFLEHNSRDVDFYNELREVVCDELILNGLKESEPSEYGIELDNLIDEIGRLFM